jgi:hypothetical protein
MTCKSLYGKGEIVKLVLLAFAFATVSGCHQEEPLAKAALASLQKLQAKTQVGVSREEYSIALGDANFAVNQYLDAKNPSHDYSDRFSSALHYSIFYYSTANDEWQSSIDHDDIFLRCDGAGKDLCSKFPDLVHQEHGTHGAKGIASMDFVTNDWKTADEYVQKAVAAEPK